MKNNRVVIIGLDGISTSILGMLFNRGVMLKLKPIVRKCKVYKELSTIPPSTLPAWTSIFSGVNPGKHGVVDFLVYKSKELRVVSSLDISVPRIYQITSVHGLKNIVINVPASTPFFMFKGIGISDWLAPKHQLVVRDQVNTGLRKILIEYPQTSIGPLWHYASESTLLEELYHEVDRKMHVLRELYMNYDFNLYVVVISETDWIMHRMLPKIIRGHGKNVHKAYKIFNKIADFVSFVYSNLDRDDMLILVSDHGFNVYNKVFDVCTYLQEKGLIKPSCINIVVRMTKRIGILSEKLLSVVRRLVSLRRELIFQLRERDTIRDVIVFLSESCPAMYVENNVLRQYVYKLLLDAKNLGENVKPVSHVWFREELYWGEEVRRLPDIIFLPNVNEGYWFSTNCFNPTIYDNTISNHDLYGFAAIFADDYEFPNMGVITTYDIVPTALLHLKLPLPHNIDGKSLIGYGNKLTIRYYNYLQRYKIARKISAYTSLR